MANFFSGMIKGGIVSAVALVTASVLLPARPKLPSAEITQSISQNPAPAIVQAPKVDAADPAAATPVPTPKVVTHATPAEAGAISDAVKPAQKSTAIAPTAVAEPKTPPKAPTVAKEALLDQNLDIAAAEPIASGSKMVAAPSGSELPKIGNDPVAATSQEMATANVSQAQPEAPVVTVSPLQKYAAPFSNPMTKPLFAVILRDTGAKDLDRAALAALPFPVTFAIDPEAENATEAMSIYRAAGKEVVMLTAGLPNGATAQDLEQSFQTYDTILPETVAVMGPAKGGFQDNAVLSKLIVSVIAGQGRGLITFDRGLNSAAQNAARAGLANATVFRQVDGGGESVPVIRRYLDRAVFKAAQDGAAIIMGETMPDTITALTEWSLEGRATDVTLAPVSAILR